MDFVTIRESDNPWKLNTHGEVLQMARHIEGLMGKYLHYCRSLQL